MMPYVTILTAFGFLSQKPRFLGRLRRGRFNPKAVIENRIFDTVFQRRSTTGHFACACARERQPVSYEA